MKANMNDLCRVVLKPTGIEALAVYHETLLTGKPLPYKAGDVFKCQLWELASIFGVYLYNGCDTPFETTIELEADE